MPFPIRLEETRPAKVRHRRSGILLVAFAAILLWLAFLPALLSRDNLLLPDGGCWLRGYRDPVTGRDTAFASRDLRRVEACRAEQGRGRL